MNQDTLHLAEFLRKYDDAEGCNLRPYAYMAEATAQWVGQNPDLIDQPYCRGRHPDFWVFDLAERLREAWAEAHNCQPEEYSPETFIRLVSGIQAYSRIWGLGEVTC